MNRVVIVLVSVDYVNAKEICNQTQNKDFKSTQEILNHFYQHLVKEEDFIGDVMAGNINTLSLNEFMVLCNEQSSELEDNLVCYVTKNINLSNEEIYKQWEQTVKFDTKVVGDLGDFDCLCIELDNGKEFRIGYDIENDRFYFSKIELDQEEQIISYSDNQNNLEYWQRLVEVEIKSLK